ncbi:MAG: hypothetical protein ACM34A_12170 [Bacillota bacterium]
MTTAADIINMALKDIGVIASGETASAEDAADALMTLNQMIGQWQAQKSYVTGQQAISFNVTGEQTYSIGSGADINTTLPVAIDSAFYRLNGIDYPVDVLNSFEDYENITLKTITGTIPSAIFYRRDYPNGTIYVWPQPQTGSINLVTRDNLPTYAALTDPLNVPAEYELALRYSLAELLLVSFPQATPRMDVVSMAQRARRVMKRNNLNIPMMGQPQEVLSNGRFSIYSGR